MQTITPVPGAIGHQQRVKAVAITNSDSLIPFTSTFLPLPTFLAYQRHLAPSLAHSVSAPASPPLPSSAWHVSIHSFPRFTLFHDTGQPLSLSIVPIFSFWSRPTSSPFTFGQAAIVKVTL